MMAQKDQMVMLEPEAAAEARHVLVDCGTWSKGTKVVVSQVFVCLYLHAVYSHGVQVKVKHTPNIKAGWRCKNYRF
jgi:hypothetical protein